MVGGLAALFLGVWPVVWGSIVAAFSFVVAALAFALPIPVWVLLVGIVGLVIAVIAVARRYLRPGQVQATQLAGLDTRILQELARADGLWLGISELITFLSVPSWLLIEQSLEKLQGLDLIITSRNQEGTRYRLSSSGRDFAIAEGYVPTAAS
jgi:hypothetical protein